MSDDLKFNKDKHDAKADARQQAEAVQIKIDVLQKIARRYDQMRQGLDRKRKKVPGSQLMNEFVDELRQLIESQCSHPALADFRSMALKMIEEKGELLRIVNTDQKNVFTPYRPTFMAPDQSEAGLPQALQPTLVRFSFKTEREFRTLEAVRRVADKPGFIGFALDGPMVVAIFDDGELVRVGSVVNGFGLEHIPGIDQFAAKLTEFRSRNGKPPKK